MKKYTNSSSSTFILFLLCILVIIAVVFAITRSGSQTHYHYGSSPGAMPPPMSGMGGMGGMDEMGMGMPAAMFQGNGRMWPPNVLGNPYAAPLRDERYLVGPPMVPINVPTNPGYVETSYRQMGVLSPVSGKGNDDLLILMGRPLFTNRDQWQYYAVSNQRNGVKLPLTVSGKNATNEYGVKEIYDGTTVMVNGYNKPYKVGMYESDTIKYLPYV